MPTFRHYELRLAVPVGKMKRRFPRRRQRTAFLLLPYPDSLFFLPTFSLYKERKTAVLVEDWRPFRGQMAGAVRAKKRAT